MAGEVKEDRAFTVIRIDELTRISDMGQPEHYYRATVRTRGGTMLKVEIDGEDFIPTRAREIIKERAENADKIKAL